jgi:hypothetical protein
MPTYRVMFVMPVSCIVEVVYPDRLDLNQDANLVIEAAEMKVGVPCFTDQNWNASEARALDGKGEPFMIELVED